MIVLQMLHLIQIHQYRLILFLLRFKAFSTAPTGAIPIIEGSTP